jgi:beta-glucosidase
MTLQEKMGQMTLVEKDSIRPGAVTGCFIGALLSGGGGYPNPNTPEAWVEMVRGFQQAGLQTRLEVPRLYGVDALHGHNNVKGATIFPHNVGLGAAGDADLVERIGRVTALAVTATGIDWNFAPVVAVPQDIRWGRTYEAYGEDTELVTMLGTAYLRGLQGESLADAHTMLATPKHFLGDGGTSWGTSRTDGYKLDQGDTQVDEATLRAVYLPPYEAAVGAGALSIMVSFNSWNGTKMHAQRYLLTDVLKGELGFPGFLVSDWQAIDQICDDYYQAVVTAVTAGVDMSLVPYDYRRFLGTLSDAVTKGDVPIRRIDDAVRRILAVKFALGLFEHPYADPDDLALVDSDEYRTLAREAVGKSLVLLKNDNRALPIAKDKPLIFVAGEAADDIGIQSGGWTIEWQGKTGSITSGTTILTAIQCAVSDGSVVHYHRFGDFDQVLDDGGNPAVADVGIAVVGERPYAEGRGDSNNLTLSERDLDVIERLRLRSHRLIVILISGRPLVVNDALRTADAFVAAWLPGTEGQGVADVLFGDVPFRGKLPYSWPRSMSQLPFDFANLPTEGCDAPLFPFGYGLETADSESG